MSTPADKRETERDAEPERRSLYTTIKPDHQYPYSTEEPCQCRDGQWEKYAMRARFPRPPGDEARPEPIRRPQRSKGRSR